MNGNNPAQIERNKMNAEQEKNRLERIAKVIKDSKIEAWSAETHIRMIMAEVKHVFPEIGSEENKVRRIALAESLAMNGLGGNASQFRQWLENPKGANLLKKTPTLDDRFADI